MEESGEKVNRFVLVDLYIQKQLKKENGHSKTQCFRIFGVSSTGYYNYIERKKDIHGKLRYQAELDRQVMNQFREIIKKLGFVPGKRTFRTHMWRDYNTNISVKRCQRLMRDMNLFANRPKKDAYKGQATYYHPCTAKQNYVDQNFKIGPRQVILTDITYLYYGTQRSVSYLCVFFDAFTNEILGHALRTRMTTDLVKEAYDEMMEKHRGEIKGEEVYLHSDQGSQYLSSTFKQLVEDDEFIQSVSARGNSQDNAPMESFFGRMKTAIIDIIAMCPTLDKAKQLVSGYLNMHNTQNYQNTLAGLTPKEYYSYCMTGIYPLDNYYGVKATDLLTIENLVEIRLEKARKKAARVRKATEAKRKERSLLKSPGAILERDQRINKSELARHKEGLVHLENQIAKLEELKERISQAQSFYYNASAEVKEDLKNPQNWKNYEVLSYVNDLNALY